MIKFEQDYEGHKQWKPNAIQEVIAEEGETLGDAIQFMREHLVFYGREDLTFLEREITRDGDHYFFTLRSKSPDFGGFYAK